MKATKTILELVDEPRSDIDEVLLEVADEYIEVKAASDATLQLAPGKYRYIDLSDAKIKDSLFNNVATFRSTVVRCIFSKTQMTGLQLPEGNFKHVVFKNCRMNLTNFRSSTFLNCVFEDCDLTEADLGGSSLTNVLFLNCQLAQADFSNCKNKRLEFEGCALSAINGINGLRGAAISNQNLIEIAALLAQDMNITVNN
jgi:uncharacterized protein YjbI with pentapeptide repeats